MSASLSQLVFAFVEDGTLSVFPDKQAAATEFEGIDVESGTVTFFDARGVRLKPQFAAPNERGSILGIASWIKSAAYGLEPDLESTEESLALLLFEAQHIEPNPWFATTGEVQAFLRAAGAEVDVPPQRPSGEA